MDARSQALIESHRSYAHAIAAEVLRKLPSHAEKDELEAAANLGLVEAAQMFDSSRGVQFKTFSYYRIRGAVYDSIRRATWVSKTEYDKVRAEAAANEYMTDYADGKQSDGSPAQLLDSMSRASEALATCYFLSLEAENAPNPEDPSQDAEERLIASEQGALLREAIGNLPDNQRAVFEGYYFQGKKFNEIADGLGLSKSRVCRIHAKGLEALRDALSGVLAAPVG